MFEKQIKPLKHFLILFSKSIPQLRHKFDSH